MTSTVNLVIYWSIVLWIHRIESAICSRQSPHIHNLANTLITSGDYKQYPATWLIKSEYERSEFRAIQGGSIQQTNVQKIPSLNFYELRRPIFCKYSLLSFYFCFLRLTIWFPFLLLNLLKLHNHLKMPTLQCKL